MKEIKAYLGNTLTPTQKEAFEQRMQQDPSLKKSVEEAIGELMAAYFDQELSEKEKQQIDQRRQDNPLFQSAYIYETSLEKNADTLSEMQYWLETYDKVKLVYDKNRGELVSNYAPAASVVDIRQKSLESEESSINQKTTSEGNVKPFTWLRPVAYAIAACLVLLLLINLGRNQYASSTLSQKYFGQTTAPDAGITLSADALEEGLIAFDKQEYTEALSLFSQIADSSSNYPISRYLSGYAHLQTGDIDQAISIYEGIIQKGQDKASPLFVYVERSRWFLSLSYLQKDQEEKAKNLLEKIVQDPDHYKHTAAEELLSDLDHILH